VFSFSIDFTVYTKATEIAKMPRRSISSVIAGKALTEIDVSEKIEEYQLETAKKKNKPSGSKAQNCTLEGLSATSVLTGSVHTTVNALREAFAIQKVLELDARGGTRYFEILKAHFGGVEPELNLKAESTSPP
jgi:hypothetical protein